MEANILVTFDPSHAGKAKDVIKAMMPEAQILETLDGAALLSAKDPKASVKRLAELCKDSPAKFEHTFHWVPVEMWCAADINDMQDAMKEIDKKIDKNKTWKLEVNKRSFRMHMTELIEKLAEHINKPKVDLKRPEQIVHVEIVGDKAAISLLHRDEIFNVKKIAGEG